jgi:hypothetical protein
MRRRIRTVGLALATLTLLFAGCERGVNSPPPTAQPSEETFKDFQNYEVHYNAVRTDSLTADIAKAYGIQRAANRVMLNVTVLRKAGDHQPRVPVEAAVDVDAYNLNGQLKDLEVRRVSDLLHRRSDHQRHRDSRLRHQGDAAGRAEPSRSEIQARILLQLRTSRARCWKNRLAAHCSALRA